PTASFRKGVTVAMHPEHFTFVLNFVTFILILVSSFGFVWSYRGQPRKLQPQAVAHHAHRTQRHSGGSDHRVEKKPIDRIKYSRRERNSDDIVYKSPEEILPDHPDCFSRQRQCLRNGPEVGSDKSH